MTDHATPLATALAAIARHVAHFEGARANAILAPNYDHAPELAHLRSQLHDEVRAALHGLVAARDAALEALRRGITDAPDAVVETLATVRPILEAPVAVKDAVASTGLVLTGTWADAW